MAASMVSVAEARSRAVRVVERSQRDWAAAIVRGEQPDASFEVVLRPPTERQVLADSTAAVTWAQGWRSVAASESLPLSWAERRWPSVGAQLVPERLAVAGVDAIAAFAGARTRRDWQRLAARAGAIRSRFVDGGVGAVAVADAGAAGAGEAALGAAVRAESRALVDYDDREFATLLDVVEWLAANPSSGRRVRELPIRGIDTKWLEVRRRVVGTLYGGVTGETSLGLAESQSTVRVRFLDPSLRPGGLEDVSAPVAQLAALLISPHVVYVFENLETVLAMPPTPGAVVVHGSGYAVARLGSIPWIREAHVLYWGDLDSDGFRALHTLRTVVPKVTSVLMDEATLDRFVDLAVVEKRPAPGDVHLLTDAESRVLERLRAADGTRLEQERIPWVYALDALQRAATDAAEQAVAAG